MFFFGWGRVVLPLSCVYSVAALAWEGVKQLALLLNAIIPCFAVWMLPCLLYTWHFHPYILQYFKCTCCVTSFCKPVFSRAPYQCNFLIRMFAMLCTCEWRNLVKDDARKGKEKFHVKTKVSAFASFVHVIDQFNRIRIRRRWRFSILAVYLKGLREYRNTHRDVYVCKRACITLPRLGVLNRL